MIARSENLASLFQPGYFLFVLCYRLLTSRWDESGPHRRSGHHRHTGARNRWQVPATCDIPATGVEQSLRFGQFTRLVNSGEARVAAVNSLQSRWRQEPAMRSLRAQRRAQRRHCCSAEARPDSLLLSPRGLTCRELTDRATVWLAHFAAPSSWRNPWANLGAGWLPSHSLPYSSYRRRLPTASGEMSTDHLGNELPRRPPVLSHAVAKLNAGGRPKMGC